MNGRSTADASLSCRSRAIALASAVSFFAAACSGGGGGGGGGPPTPSNGFPTHAGNKFSIQYRNSTAGSIVIWLEGAQPPCSKAEAASCQAGKIPADYTANWAAMKDAFSRSGTAFFRVKADRTSASIAVSNSVTLAAGEVLRIVPPIVTENNYERPEWYYKHFDSGVVMTSGVKAWATKTGSTMYASKGVMVYEVTLDPARRIINHDISAVDGINANATMVYTGCATSQQKSCKTRIAPYDGANDGCPYAMQFDGTTTCPNPKHWPKTALGNVVAPPWVIPADAFTAHDVDTTYVEYWTGARTSQPTGFQMADAGSGYGRDKMAYHIWWATNPVAKGWLTYLQKNKAGACDAYGWAYDEKRWDPAACHAVPYATQDCFERDLQHVDDLALDTGNPASNPLQTDVECGYVADSYLNIDILELM